MKFLMVIFLFLTFLVMPITIYADNSQGISNPQSISSNEEQNPWVSLGFYGLTVAISVVGTLILFAGKVGIKKLEKKLGIKIPDVVEEMAEGIIVKGINVTENWAKKQSDKPTSENKMAETIKFALKRAENNEFIRKKIEDKGKEIVERLLRSNETPTEVTPK